MLDLHLLIKNRIIEPLKKKGIDVIFSVIHIFTPDLTLESFTTQRIRNMLICPEESIEYVNRYYRFLTFYNKRRSRMRKDMNDYSIAGTYNYSHTDHSLSLSSMINIYKPTLINNVELGRREQSDRYGALNRIETSDTMIVEEHGGWYRLMYFEGTIFILVSGLLASEPDLVKRTIIDKFRELAEEFYYAVTGDESKSKNFGFQYLISYPFQQLTDIQAKLIKRYRERLIRMLELYKEGLPEILSMCGFKPSGNGFVYEVEIIPKFVHVGGRLFRLKPGHPYFIKDLVFNLNTMSIRAKKAQHINVSSFDNQLCTGDVNASNLITEIIEEVWKIAKKKQIDTVEEHQNSLNSVRAKIEKLCQMFEIMNQDSSYCSVDKEHLGPVVELSSAILKRKTKKLEDIEVRRI